MLIVNYLRIERQESVEHCHYWLIVIVPEFADGSGVAISTFHPNLSAIGK
jgi:hypothetical protein